VQSAEAMGSRGELGLLREREPEASVPHARAVKPSLAAASTWNRRDGETSPVQG